MTRAPVPTLDALEALDQPDQPRAYDLRTAAEALGIGYDRLRGWVRAGDLRTLQRRPNTVHLVPLSELQRLARDGWPIDPRPLIDAE